MVEHSEVGVPSVDGRHRLAEPHGFCWGMTGELIADSAARDDDARLSVSAQQHTQSTGIEVKRSSVSAARKRVPDNHNLELGVCCMSR